MAQVKTKEKCNLKVDGNQFEDWTSIWVQRTAGSPYDQFKFSCAERDGASASDIQSSKQFKPGQKCKIELAGKPAFEGFILQRQCAYDANSHSVQLQGTNQTWAPATSGIEHETNSYDGKTFRQIAEDVLVKRCRAKGVQWKGEPPQRILPYVHIEQGETAFDFIKRLGTNVNVVVGCDKEGNFVMLCDGFKGKDQGQLEEGKNILKMQCVIRQDQKYTKIIVHGQGNGGGQEGGEEKEDDPDQMRKDEQIYQPIAEQFYELDLKDDEVDYERIKFIMMEQPDITKEICEKRAKSEEMWDLATEVSATIVVYGWSPEDGGDLWEPGADVSVTSPMAMLKGQKLRIQSVTYTQDNSGGSLTTLVCIQPGGLHGPKIRI